MGYMIHDAVVITGIDLESKDKESEHYIKAIREKAIKFYSDYNLDGEVQLEECVSGVVGTGINGYVSFFLSPSGSKEGWETSHREESARTKFLDYLDREHSGWVDYVHLRFGGDHEREPIIERTNTCS